MISISEDEVWLRAYCSALTGLLTEYSRGCDDAALLARYCANQAVKDFAGKFPPFQFASNESKTITAPADPIA